MKRVLIVSYYFPPVNTIGAVRIGKFAKFLPRYGWETYVLTVEPELTGIPQDLPVEVEPGRVMTAGWEAWIARLRHMVKNGIAPASIGSRYSRKSSSSGLSIITKNLFRYVSCKFNTVRLPDRAFPWYRKAIAKGMAFLRHNKVDVIFSSSGPVGSHIVASVLARRTGIPWIADYRDLWSQNHVTKYRPVFTMLERHIERAILAPCRIATTVTPSLAYELESLLDKPVKVIFNGYDPDDYCPNVTSLPQFTLTYTGRLYPPHRDPTMVFEAISGLKDEGITPSRLSLRFYSPPDVSSVYVVELAKRFGVEDFVEWKGYVPYMESLQKQQESTALLLLEFTGSEGILTGKIFEYLGAGRPILGIGQKDGEIESLLRRTRTGIALATAEEVKAQLRLWLTEFELTGRIAYEPDLCEIQKYSRAAQSRLLAELMENIIS